MAQKRFLIVAVVAGACVWRAPVASAQNYASGPYAELHAGASGFLDVNRDYAAIGPSLGVRAGYDLFRWLSLGGYALGSTHEATLPPPPEQEFFQIYQAGGEGQLRQRFGQFGVFAEGGAGLAFISTNVLDRVGVTDPTQTRLSPAFTVGGGFDYHLQSRHFSVGLGADYTIYPSFAAAQSLTVRLYVRYTK